MRAWPALLLTLTLIAGPARAESPTADAVSTRTTAVQAKLKAEYDSLAALYLHLHAHPELSMQEERSAARMAAELKAAGFVVTERVGQHGVVGVLANGPGPTVLVRGDMDGLPVVEKTGLPYASKTLVRDRAGTEVGTMHACGHDMHMTCLVGTARVLAGLKDQWSGTLVLIAQPAEETGTGAKAMLDDGLFTRFPRPDFALALHCDSKGRAGRVAYTEGLALANVDTVDIVVRGKGGHGASPHTTIDPVVLAARIVLDLQTIVSRETNPVDPVVVTVGSIHGGTKHNVIPNDVKLQLTVRTTKDETRKHTLDAIDRVAKAAAMGARAPEPSVTVDPGEFTPALYNDVALAKRTGDLFRRVLGPDNVEHRPTAMGGEDFGRYGRAGVPIFMYWLGTVSADRIAAAQREGASPLPSTHSDQYYPLPEPSIRTGVFTMSHAVLNLVGK